MKIRVLTLLILALLAVTSCVHREFEYDYEEEPDEVAYVSVVFDWVNEPEANPEAMSLYLFPYDGSESIHHKFVGRDGATIRVSPGLYHAICVNSDNRDVVFRNSHSHPAFEVTTTETKALNFSPSFIVRSENLPKAEGSENQPMMNQPPLLWSSSQTDILISPSPDSKNQAATQELRMYPARIVDTYVVTVKNIVNVEYLSSLSATISSMSDSYFPGSATPSDASATIPLEMTHDPGTASAEGTFLTFGHCPSGQRPHKLMLYAVLTDASKYYFEFDVSEQAHTDPDENNVHHIIIECLDLPDPSGNDPGGGMDPSVDEWHSVDIGLEM